MMRMPDARRSPMAVFAALVVSVLALTAEASSLSVSPVRIFLAPEKRAEMLTIRNTGSRDAELQLRLYRWTQDGTGKDVYEESKDLVVFPKIVKIRQGEERIIRIGRKSPAGNREESYRLYIQELPPRPIPGQQSNVGILLRMGVPVFLAPVKQTAVSAALTDLRMTAGQVQFNIANTGNRHVQLSEVVVRGIDRAGATSLERELNGWYLLGGATRAYSLPLSREACVVLSRIEVVVRSERILLKDRLDVDQTWCPK